MYYWLFYQVAIQAFTTKRSEEASLVARTKYSLQLGIPRGAPDTLLFCQKIGSNQGSKMTCYLAII